MTFKIRYKRLHRAEYGRLLFYIRGAQVSEIRRSFWGWYYFEVAISDSPFKNDLQPV